MKRLILLMIILCTVLIISCDRKPRITTIRIGYTDYSFDRAVVFTLKAILDQQANLNVEIFRVEDDVMIDRLAEGELDVAVSLWLPNTHAEFIEKYPYEIQKSGLLCDSLGLYMTVPTYAPFSTIEDLKSYAGLLRNTIIIPESQNAILYQSKNIIEDYHLSQYKIQEMAWDDIVSHIENSLNRTSGFAFVGIRPHWIYKRYNVKTVSDPLNALGEKESAYIYINSRFSEKAPVIAEFLSKVRFTLRDIETLIEMNQTLGSEPYENSLRWISANTGRINRWLISEND